MSKEPNLRRRRDERIQYMAKIFYKKKDEYQLWEIAKGYGVTHATAKDYVHSAMVLSKQIPRILRTTNL